MPVQSKGALIVERLLRENHIPYQKEVVFEDCKDKYVLPFDFGVKNPIVNSWLYLIEFDGEQHYYPITKFGGIDGHRKTVRHDIIKNRYCLVRRIPLIRIPYWERDNLTILDLNPLTSKFLVRTLYHNEQYVWTHPDKIRRKPCKSKKK